MNKSKPNKWVSPDLSVAEWGGRGVRCNAVCPGWVKTEMDVVDQAGGNYTDEDITGRNPMGRFATPNDIARAILFLADAEQSGFINGQALPVDGGWSVDGSWQSLRMQYRSLSGVWLSWITHRLQAYAPLLIE